MENTRVLYIEWWWTMKLEGQLYLYFWGHHWTRSSNLHLNSQTTATHRHTSELPTNITWNIIISMLSTENHVWTRFESEVCTIKLNNMYCSAVRAWIRIKQQGGLVRILWVFLLAIFEFLSRPDSYNVI